MSKNPLLLAKLRELPKVDGAAPSQDLLKALESLVQAKTLSELRITALKYPVSLGGDAKAFEGDTNNDQFLDNSAGGLKALQQAAATKRVLLGLSFVSADELKKILSTESLPDLRTILGTTDKLGKLSSRHEDWLGDVDGQPLLTDDSLQAIKNLAGELLLQPINTFLKTVKEEQAVAYQAFQEAFAVVLKDPKADEHDLNAAIANASAQFYLIMEKYAELEQRLQTESDTLKLLGREAGFLVEQGALKQICDATKAAVVAAQRQLGDLFRGEKQVIENELTAKQPNDTVERLMARVESASAAFVAAEQVLNLACDSGVAHGKDADWEQTRRASMEVTRLTLTELKLHLYAKQADKAASALADMESKLPQADQPAWKQSEARAKLALAEQQLQALTVACDEAEGALEALPAEKDGDDARQHINALKRQIQAAVKRAEASIAPVRATVVANFYMDYAEGQLDHFTDMVVKKGEDPDARLQAAQREIATDEGVGQQGPVAVKRKGVLLVQGDVIRSVARFPGAAAGAGAGAAPDKIAIIEQDHTGRVRDLTDADTYKKLTPKEQSLVAIKEARMLLNSYKPERGPFIIRGNNSEKANRIYAALLALKGTQPIEIECRVEGSDKPTKTSIFQSQSSAEEAFIKKYLAIDDIELTAERKHRGRMVDAAVEKRQFLAELRASGSVDTARQEALKVGQPEIMDLEGNSFKGPA